MNIKYSSEIKEEKGINFIPSKYVFSISIVCLMQLFLFSSVILAIISLNHDEHTVSINSN